MTTMSSNWTDRLEQQGRGLGQVAATRPFKKAASLPGQSGEQPANRAFQSVDAMVLSGGNSAFQFHGLVPSAQRVRRAKVSPEEASASLKEYLARHARSFDALGKPM